MQSYSPVARKGPLESVHFATSSSTGCGQDLPQMLIN